MNLSKPSLSITCLLLCLLLGGFAYGQDEDKSGPEPETTANNPAKTPTETSTETDTGSEPIVRPKLDKQYLAQEKMEALAKEIDPESLLWLGEGENRFLGVYQEAWRPLPYGAAIVLHSDGQHPRWPHTSRVLSDNLAKHGWTSLAISLPSSLPEAIPKRTTVGTIPSPMSTDPQSENSPDGNPEEVSAPVDKTQENTASAAQEMAAEESSMTMTEEDSGNTVDPEAQAYERLMEAYEYLRQQGLLNIAIICEGQSVIRAVKMIADIPVAPPSNPQATVAKPIAALVSINAASHIPGDPNFNLAKSMADLDLYVLDIYFDEGEESLQLAQQRKAHALRAGLPVYRQQQLPLPSSKLALGENPMSKRVRGFLNRYAKGRAKTL
ncbi:DUF3530 family protein [Pseudoteredinibacter isoporae]|uniref:DUF3530 family protein n=1 Tax=Pseudoteredinibacter isoporae TaxID=570281 RepID=A0A7X0JRW6_9GAMM|nr:DUF3530 family protein [Pseudoteredinibacter isoporae]MBB6521173.1 hypothetical protein [Pseudoteredinibacter isoporae]NHO86733.1 DUF3530 family protein [Pseudoteredinibacter isoporae]NIB24815.1 DUF3530 family protein [Pseudoteredinibacter isoporae]